MASAKRKGDMSDMPSVQPTEQPRTSPPGYRGSGHMPRHPSCERLPECSVSQALATGALEACQIHEVGKLEDQTGFGCGLLTDHLTP